MDKFEALTVAMQSLSKTFLASSEDYDKATKEKEAFLVLLDIAKKETEPSPLWTVVQIFVILVSNLTIFAYLRPFTQTFEVSMQANIYEFVFAIAAIAVIAVVQLFPRSKA